jgi:hypothetical protein
MPVFSENVIAFNKELNFKGKLPANIRVLNPFKENSEAMALSEKFYRKFYDDRGKRKMILGINPGRFGAGLTGVPFSDSKRLTDVCCIPVTAIKSHEPSSVFIYDMIARYGGPVKFYGDYYINSVCPLGFIELNSKKNWINCNYYDHPELLARMRPFIVSSLQKQMKFGIERETGFILGKKNADCFRTINEENKFFKSLVVLDHPRYIEQYRSKEREKFISGYLEKLRN